MVEKFEIEIDDEVLQVVLNEDGSYTILNAKSKIGDLYPEIRNEGTVWTTTDLISPDYVDQIGELIERHYL